MNMTTNDSSESHYLRKEYEIKAAIPVDDPCVFTGPNIDPPVETHKNK